MPLNDYLNSIKNINKAKPREDLFHKIETNLGNRNINIIPFQKLKWVAAAAVILFCINSIVIYTTIRQESAKKHSSPNFEFVTNFKYYK